MSNGSLTNKQKRFCEEYVTDCNATQAAIRAGYSQKTARVVAAQNLSKLNIQNYIAELMNELKQESKITAENVLDYWTAVMRGEVTEETLKYDSMGKQITIETKPQIKDRLKASDMIAKHLGMYSSQVDVNIQNLEFVDDLKEDGEE